MSEPIQKLFSSLSYVQGEFFKRATFFLFFIPFRPQITFNQRSHLHRGIERLINNKKLGIQKTKNKKVENAFGGGFFPTTRRKHDSPPSSCLLSITSVERSRNDVRVRLRSSSSSSTDHGRRNLHRSSNVIVSCGQS